MGRRFLLIVAAWLLFCPLAWGFAGGGCFLPDTPVLLANGQSVPIRQVIPGTRLLAFDETGKVVVSTVRQVFRHEANEYLIIRTGRRQVRVTPGHPFHCGAGQFKRADNLQVGEAVHVRDDEKLVTESITGITRVTESVTVCNLFTDAPHTYFAAGVAVHNKGGGGSGGGGGGGGFSGGSSYSSGGGEGLADVFSFGASDTDFDEDSVGDWILLLLIVGPIWYLLAFTLGIMFGGVGWFALESCFPKFENIDWAAYYETAHHRYAIRPLLYFLGAILVIPFIPAYLFWCGTILFFKWTVVYFMNLGNSSGNLDVVIGRRQINKKKKKTLKLLKFIAKVDEDWQPDKLEDHARKLFIKLQEHWQARDYRPVKDLIEPRIYRDHTRQLQGLKRNHEINVIDDLKIKHVDLVHVRYTHKPEDREYTAVITVSAINYYVDDRTKKFIRGDKTPLDHQEFWTFQWSEGQWLLREIEQAAASDILTDVNLFEQFTDEGVKQIYGDEAETAAEAGPWLEEEVEVKDKKIERLLNFLVQIDKIWDRREMLGLAREVFLQVMLDREQGKLSRETLENLQPGIAKHLRQQMKHTQIEYRNLSVRKVELALVRNFNEKENDEYTVRIRAHAQIIVKRKGKVIQKQADVTPWEEYWVFGREEDRWKLKEIFPDEQGNAIWDQENFDEDTTQQMLDWYYSKSRAV